MNNTIICAAPLPRGFVTHHHVSRFIFTTGSDTDHTAGLFHPLCCSHSVRKPRQAWNAAMRRCPRLTANSLTGDLLQLLPPHHKTWDETKHVNSLCSLRDLPPQPAMGEQIQPEPVMFSLWWGLKQPGEEPLSAVCWSFLSFTSHHVRCCCRDNAFQCKMSV